MEAFVVCWWNWTGKENSSVISQKGWICIHSKLWSEKPLRFRKVGYEQLVSYPLILWLHFGRKLQEHGKVCKPWVCPIPFRLRPYFFTFFISVMCLWLFGTISNFFFGTEFPLRDLSVTDSSPCFVCSSLAIFMCWWINGHSFELDQLQLVFRNAFCPYLTKD